MSDEKKSGMGAKSIISGAVAGAGVGYGVSAISGKSLKNLKFTNIGESLKDGMKNGLGSFKEATEFFIKEKITPQQVQISATRSMLKMGEEIGFDMNSLMTDMRELRKLGSTGVTDTEKMQSAFMKMKPQMEKYFQLLHTKAPTVNEYVKLTDRFRQILANTLAETLGKEGDVRTKFVEEYIAAITKPVKPLMKTIGDVGRKIISAVKYEKAAWYEKPIVAFEAMSTKGKLGLGALVTASTLGTAYMLSGRSSDSEEKSR